MTHDVHTLRSSGDLLAAGYISAEDENQIAAVGKRYAIAVPPAIAHLIDSLDSSDPIKRQFVPDVRELDSLDAELTDPIADDAYSPIDGIVHRYSDRVLLKLTGTCPVYCRFCFRREMIGPGTGVHLMGEKLEQAIAYIANNPKIWEVIVTGGDPLILSARRLRDVTQRLSEIDHVKVLRWHTRVPVVAPERVTPEVVGAMTATQQTVYVSVHVNHASELTAGAREACARLADTGACLVSQSVLLRGVNDDVATLEALMRALTENRIKPYYLHHGDLAPGTSHFRTTITQGLDLMDELRQRLSGLALPNYVLDLPGGFGKVVLTREGVALNADGSYAIADPTGRIHNYRDACRESEVSSTGC